MSQMGHVEGSLPSVVSSSVPAWDGSCKQRHRGQKSGGAEKLMEARSAWNRNLLTSRLQRDLQQGQPTRTESDLDVAVDVCTRVYSHSDRCDSTKHLKQLN